MTLDVQYQSASEWAPGTICVYNASAVPNGLVVKLVERDESDSMAHLSREDAIDLAWSVLEHYGVAERPTPPLAVGDFVELNGNRLGKVQAIDGSEPAVYVRTLTGGPHGQWRYSANVTRITREEFLQKAADSATAQANAFAGKED